MPYRTLDFIGVKIPVALTMFKLACLVALAMATASAMPSVPLRRDNIDERGQYVEGDMRFPPGINAGLIDEKFRWPNAQLAYQLDPTFTADELVVINAGLQDIMDNTCIRLVPRTSESDFVLVVRGGPDSGCWSYVGRIGGQQELNLQAGNPGCIHKGIVSHEFIHALGYHHEQSRIDRDDFVDIVWDNINPGAVSNFDKYSSDEVSDFGVSYDYGSVMHYSAYSFAVDPSKPTIVPKDPDAIIGQRNGLSLSDAQKLRNMYKCGA